MISKHSHEQSDRGEGVEVVQNEPYEDPEHGQGQFTEKRVYLNRSLEQVLSFFIVEDLNNLCVEYSYTLLHVWLRVQENFNNLCIFWGRILWSTGHVLCL